MIGERIRRARKAAGLPLRALADQIGLSHTTLSLFERGQRTPTSKQIIAISRALGVRSEFLLRTTDVELGAIAYRSGSSLPAKLRHRIHADVRDQLERWQQLLDLFPVEVLPDFALPDRLPAPIATDEDIENAAEVLRGAWRLGEDPIPDLIDTLEFFGILVVQTNADGAGRFNGLSASLGESPARPVIVVGAGWPGDRQRFTLAHELGHLVLAHRMAPGMNVEKACNRFAGAFLLPASAVHQTLGEHRRSLEPRELSLLKSEYGLSMQGCLFRALQAGVIAQTTHERLFRLFTKRGWRKEEPGPAVPPEHTVRFEQLVYHALAEDFIGESKAAELLQMPVTQFHRERRMEGTDAAPCQ